MSDDYPATRECIVDTFLNLPWDSRMLNNWGTAMDPEEDAKWNCNSETYINGIMIHVDCDYNHGWLIECVDRETGILTYHAIAEATGGRHESMVYEYDCGTFFERTEAANPVTLGVWGVTCLYNMLHSMHEEEQNS